ncbi:MAG TPA: hypothetical protein VLI04_13505 [Nocardioidaceae bacterium]|nr:hypothetical protein [Nocardioidaceae bacterium]
MTAAPASAADCGGLLQPPCPIVAVVDLTTGYPTQIDASGITKTRTGTFNFNVTVPQPDLLYQCYLAPIQTTYVDCTTPVAANVNTPGSMAITQELPYADGYVVHVRAAKKPFLIGDPVWGPDATFTFHVRPDLTFPETSITGVPPYWYMGYLLSMDLHSKPKATSFECTLDSKPHPCGPTRDTDGDLLNWFGVTPGDHLLTAAAVRTVNGITVKDPTPSVVRLNKPQSATKLTGLRFWKKEYKRGPMLGQCIYAERKGASITKGFQRLTRIALVVTKAPGYGSLKVLIDNRADDAGFKLVKRIDLASGSTRYRQVIQVRRFRVPTNGVLKIVSESDSRVQIEGLGRSSL